MSDKIPTDTTDASELFDVDFGSNPVSSGTPRETKKESGNNPYEAVEDVLGIPRGSTKEGIAAAKKEVKRITDEAKNLKVQKDILVRKEKMSDTLDLVPGFNMDDLANDRKVLRQEYMELFRRGKRMLDRIEKDVEDLVNPEPDDYANYQRQYLALLKTLDSIRGALVTLREEEEKSLLTRAKDAPAGIAGAEGGSAGGAQVAADGSVEVTPQDTNAWIAKWTAELDAEVADQIQKDFDNRNAPKAITDGTGEPPGDAGEG